MRLLAAFAVSLLLAPAAEAIHINNGELNIIDGDALENEAFQIWDGPGGATTTLRLVDGGEIGSLSGNDNSILEVFGGDIKNAIEVYDSASLTVTAGNFNWNSGAGTTVRDYGSAEISGGRFHRWLVAAG